MNKLLFNGCLWGLPLSPLLLGGNPYPYFIDAHNTLDAIKMAIASGLLYTETGNANPVPMV